MNKILFVAGLAGLIIAGLDENPTTVLTIASWLIIAASVYRYFTSEKK